MGGRVERMRVRAVTARAGADCRPPSGACLFGGTQQRDNSGESGGVFDMFGQALGTSRVGDQAGNVGLAVAGHAAPSRCSGMSRLASSDAL